MHHLKMESIDACSDLAVSAEVAHSSERAGTLCLLFLSRQAHHITFSTKRIL